MQSLICRFADLAKICYINSINEKGNVGIMRIYGFTLAEVLITLAVIGVVAAITIPTLMNNIQDAQLKTAWKKEYSILSQMVNRVATDNGGSLKGLLTDSNTARDLFKPYLKYIKECDNGASFGNCWASSYKRLNGDGNDWVDSAGLVLSDGASLMFATDSSWYSTCNGLNAATSACAYIPVDVNGPTKGPNVIGKDIFNVWVRENSISPEGATDGRSGTCSTSSTGSGCSARFLYQ